MSGLPPSDIREKTRKVLESMVGIYSLWALDITQVVRKDSNFIVIGSFVGGMLAPTKAFTITMDKDGNVIEVKIETKPSS